jgi:hypothetical protein
MKRTFIKLTGGSHQMPNIDMLTSMQGQACASQVEPIQRRHLVLHVLHQRGGRVAAGGSGGALQQGLEIS